MTQENVPAVPAEESLDGVYPLLKSTSATENFAGLTILHALLRTRPEIAESPELLMKCWNALPQRFLLRLLRSVPGPNRTEEEATHFRTLAVGVVHAFTTLLGSRIVNDPKAAAVAPALASTIPVTSAPDVKDALMETVEIISRNQEAAKAIYSANEPFLGDLIKLATKNPSAESIVTNMLRAQLESEHSQPKIMQALLANCNRSGRAASFRIIANAVADSPCLEVPIYLQTLVHRAQACFIETFFNPFSRDAMYKETEQDELFDSIATIFHHFSEIPEFDPFFTGMPGQAHDLPFSYWFATGLCKDIQATVPMIMENLGKEGYVTMATRLARRYDLLTDFVGALISIDQGSAESNRKLDIPGDKLLILRRSLNQSFSFAVEFLRDRWDAARTGAPGLDLSALSQAENASGASGASSGNEKQLRMLTWDNSTLALEKDPIVHSSIRFVALWIDEDPTERTCLEALHIMDIFLALYSYTDPAGSDQLNKPDYKHQLSLCIKAVVSNSPEAAEKFVELGGWDVISGDLKSILADPGPCPHRTLSVLRILASAVQQSLTRAKVVWLELIPLLVSTASVQQTKDPGPLTDPRTSWAFLQEASYLVGLLYMKAPTNAGKAVTTELRKLVAVLVAVRREAKVGKEGDAELADCMEVLREALQDDGK